MTSAFKLRMAGSDDRDNVFALLYGNGQNHPPPDDPRHPAHVADLIIAASFDPDSKSRCWLAIADDRPVGIITTRDLGGGVAVLDDYQGRGIGKALVTAREDFFRDHLNQVEARAPIRADNKKSIDMHLTLGYQFDQASQDLIKTHPPGETVLYMVKTLAP